MSFRLIPLLATGAFLATGGAALAQTATATSTVNVRSGPGGGYEVVDQLPAGETVRIIDCSGDWCEISMGGDSGFVARSYLDDGGRRSRARIYEERDEDDGAGYGPDEPDDTAGLVVGGYYESRPFYIREGYYYWGGRWYTRRPGVAGWRDRSWRRWGDRDGPGATRDGRTNRPPRIDDRRVRIDRDDRGGGGRTGGRDDRDDRIGGREGRGGPDLDRGDRDRGGPDRDGRSRGEGRSERGGEPIGARMDSGGGRSPGGPDGGGRTPGSGGASDRGDRIGLDRAGSGGGRGDR